MSQYTASIQQLYVAYFNRPADPSGLAYWETIVAAANGNTTAVSAEFAKSPEYVAAYAGLTDDQVINQVYLNIFGRTVDSVGLNFWSPKLTAHLVTIDQIVTEVGKGATGSDLETYGNRTDASVAYTDALNADVALRLAYSNDAAIVSAKAFLSGITTDASLTAAIEPAALAANLAQMVIDSTPAPVVTTFALTAGVDTFVGGAGNDLFTGAYSGTSGATATYSVLDSFNGGAGVDSLVVTDVVGGIDLTVATVSNIENLTLTSIGALSGDAVDLNGMTGLTSATLALKAAAAVETITAASTTSLNLVNTGAAGGIAVIGGGGTLAIKATGGIVDVNKTTDAKSAFTSATVTGTATTVDIIDTTNATGTVGSTLTTVSVTGATGATSLTGKGIVNVTATALAADLTVTNATVAHTINFTLDGASAGTVKDTAATTVNIIASGDDSVLTANDLNSVATTLTFAGAAAISTALTNSSALTAVTSTNSSGVTITSALGTGVSFAGGAGADTITLTATGTKAITMGAGNDSVTYAGPMGTGGSVDAGDGTDTIVMTAVQGVTATATTAFAATVSNFEKLSLGALANAAPAAINMANADGINHLIVAGNGTTAALTVTGFAANGTLELTGALGTDSSAALAVSSGIADVFNVNLSATNGFSSNAIALTVAAVETINITTNDTDTTAATTAFTQIITATAVEHVVVSGDAGFNASTGLGATTLTSFNASGVTATGAGGAVTFTTGDLAAAATLTGGAGTNTISAAAVSTSVAMTITGGAGLDALTGGAGADIINGGNGGTTGVGLVGNAGADTITGGTGTDTITGGTGADILTGGAGVDTFVFTTQAWSTRSSMDTITDLTAGTTSGDTITLIDTGTEVGVTAGLLTAAKTVTTLAGTFLEALDLASAGNGSTNGIVTWFQYNGDTYLVEDRSASVTNDVAADVVIKITGVVDLLNDTNLAITFA